MNRFDRVISTLVLLQSRKIITAHQIAERFQISTRTVYRDINTLKVAGIPIIGDAGVGYSIMDGYRIPPFMFSEGESTALLTAEKIIGTLTDEQTQFYYTNALLKIKAMLRSAEKHSLQRLEDSIIFPQQENWKNKPYLQDIFACIATNRNINIDYQKANGTQSSRMVEPMGCYYHAYHWYLVAFCHQQNDFRTFKINRIIQLKKLDTFFEERHQSFQDYMNTHHKHWKENRQMYTIEIAFNDTFLEHAENRKYYFGFFEQKRISDKTHITFLYSSLEVMSRWLLQFGDQATVIRPAALKTKMSKLVQQLHLHYKK